MASYAESMTITNSTVCLSQRVQQLKPSSTLAVSARVKELKAQGLDVIGFGAGEPDFDTPTPIKQAAIDALLAGQTGYQPVPGTPQAREVLAEKLQRENGVECKPEHIVITVGGKHAIYLALQALVDPGDEVIIMTPAWVSYEPIAKLCDGKVIEISTTMDQDFKITPKQFEQALTSNTKAILFNSPSNPCGTTYTPDEIRALADVLADHEQAVLISDEIYEKLIYGDIAHLSPGSISKIAQQVITINGMSKAYAMTGWRIGYACAPGCDGAIAKAMARLQGQMTSHITSTGYAAIIEAITNGSETVESMRIQFATRAELMYQQLAAIPDLKCAKPTGAFYCFPDVSSYFGRTSPQGSRIESSLDFASALLEEARVAVVPGEDFGGCSSNHVRLSFACSEENIKKGCQRISEWMHQFK